MSPCIQNERQRYDDPQHIHEHKVEPEVDRMAQLTVSIAVSVLCEEVKHCSIQLTWSHMTNNFKVLINKHFI